MTSIEQHFCRFFTFTHLTPFAYRNIQKYWGSYTPTEYPWLQYSQILRLNIAGYPQLRRNGRYTEQAVRSEDALFLIGF